MKAFLASVVVAIAIAAGAFYVLQARQQTASTAFTTDGARVGDPGSNLIGVN